MSDFIQSIVSGRFLEEAAGLMRELGCAFFRGELGFYENSVLLLSALFLILLCRLLFSSVSVLNVGFEGRSRYLGRVFLRRSRKALKHCPQQSIR